MKPYVIIASTEKEKTMEQKISLHALNKSVISAMKPLEDKEIAVALKQIEKWMLEREEYFAFFAQERRDFTVFQSVADKLNMNDVLEVFKSRGEIKAIDYVRERDAWELWIDDIFYAMFPYDEAIVCI